MKYHLVRFGFESPAERRSNEQYGSDFESSDQVWILAGSPDEALERCCAVVDRSCDVMYADAGWAAPRPVWSVDGYAHWVEATAADRPVDGVPIDDGSDPDFTLPL